MSTTKPGRARSRVGRHAADEPDSPAVPPRISWWRRLVPGGCGVDVDRPVVVRIRGELDDLGAARLVDRARAWPPRQVDLVVVLLAACDFVDVRGFRALLLLQEQVAAHSGRLIVLDPPRTLQIMCRAVPGRLVLVPSGEGLRGPTTGERSGGEPES